MYVRRVCAWAQKSLTNHLAPPEDPGKKTWDFPLTIVEGCLDNVPRMEWWISKIYNSVKRKGKNWRRRILTRRGTFSSWARKKSSLKEGGAFPPWPHKMNYSSGSRSVLMMKYPNIWQVCGCDLRLHWGVCDIAVLIMSKRKSQCKGAHPLMAPLFTKLYFSSKVT